MPEQPLTREPVDLLISAKWILPVRPANSIHTNHAVVIDNGRIRDVLPEILADTHYLPASRVDLDHHVLMPGLVNAHGHSAMTLFRGLADDLPLSDWLNHHIWPAESRWVSEAFVADGTRLAIAEMIQSGTTCFSDMYFHPDRVAETAHQLRIRSQVCFPVLDFPSVWAADADEYLKKGLALYDAWQHSDLVSIAFGPHAPYSVSDKALSRIATLTRQLDAPVQIHLHETAQEVEESLAQHGQRPIQRLADLGLLSPQLQCVHMTQVTPEDLDLLSTFNCHVIHCPESNLKLASGFAPVADIQARGINLALGTDGPASNNDLDMISEMRTAALLAKGVSGRADVLTAAEVIDMATINAASALGMADQIGTLEKGKWADIIAIDLDALNCQPLYDVISHIVYSAQARQVTHVWIAGAPRMENRNLVDINIPAIKRNARAWGEKIAPVNG